VVEGIQGAHRKEEAVEGIQGAHRKEEVVEGIQGAHRRVEVGIITGATKEAEGDAKVDISGQRMMSGLTITYLQTNSRILMTINSQTKTNSLRKMSWLMRTNRLARTNGPTTNMWSGIRLCKTMSTQIACQKAIQEGQY
jgi:hypothetical protein